MVATLGATQVVGIGRFAHDRALTLEASGVAVGYAPHPSPASPLANRGWAEQFEAALRGLGVALD